MSEVNEEELTKKFQKFVGFETGKSIYRVKGKKMVAYSESITDNNPKYTKSETTADGKEDYSKLSAHPAFPSTFTIPALFNLAEIKDEEGKLIKNIGKLLHTGQAYDFTDCEPIKDGMKLYTTGKVSKIFVKSGILWIEALLETKSNDEKLVCKTTTTVGIRKGGY